MFTLHSPSAKVVVALLPLGLLLCGNLSPLRAEENYRFSDVTLEMDPEAYPSSLPSMFNYPGSRVEMSAHSVDSVFSGGGEAIVLLAISEPLEKVIAEYERIIAKKGWNIIQTQQSGERRLIMCESPYRKIVTLIVENGSPVRVKLYFKKTGLD